MRSANRQLRICQPAGDEKYRPPLHFSIPAGLALARRARSVAANSRTDTAENNDRPKFVIFILLFISLNTITSINLLVIKCIVFHSPGQRGQSTTLKHPEIGGLTDNTASENVRLVVPLKLVQLQHRNVLLGVGMAS